jgi:hypothetical protein
MAEVGPAARKLVLSARACGDLVFSVGKVRRHAMDESAMVTLPSAHRLATPGSPSAARRGQLHLVRIGDTDEMKATTVWVST